jgi:O-methyltransferase
VRKIIRKALNAFGFDIRRVRDWDDNFQDLSDEQKQVIAMARPYTMTSVERMVSLLGATDYIVRHRIEGDIAECGVWRGGSMMVIAQALLALGDRSRTLYLFDTFEGMSAPSKEDVSVGGRVAIEHIKVEPQWCYATIEDVRRNLLSTGYPADKIRFLKGKVEDTIPATLPGPLALLRLDTDWYESTRHELQHLYPLLKHRGIMVIDDYGHWQGARKAVDEYFAGNSVFLHRIDYTGRLLVKH